MRNISRDDPDAKEKLHRRLVSLKHELQEMMDQDAEAKKRGEPTNPQSIKDSLRNRIRQTEKRLKALEGEGNPPGVEGS